MWKTQPHPYGTLHFIAIGFMVICAAVGIYLGIKYKGNKYDRSRDKALSTLGFVIIGLEAFKIIFRIATHENVDLTLISFQICSIPMYLLPWIAYMKEGKLKKAFLGYVSFQAFVSAFFYFVKPNAIFTTKYVIISLHSIVWHSLLVAMSLFVMVSYGLLSKKGCEYLILGNLLWIGTAFIAMILDVILRKAVPGSAVDLFYIAPGSTFKYPLLSLIFPKPEPYALYFVSFLIYYTLGCIIIYAVGCGITALATRGKRKN